MDKKRILVVDDEIDLVEMLTMRLEANDYEVFAACDGQEGLDKASTLKPDLILLDILMPKLDGFKVCQALKNDPLTSNIPVIMLTAKDRTDDIKQAKQVGASGYLIKPFNAATLLFDIKEQLDKVKMDE